MNTPRYARGVEKIPWYQTNLAAGLIATICGGAIFSVLTWLYGEVAALPLPLPLPALILVALIAIVIAATLISRKWRGAIWAQAFGWLFGHKWLSMSNQGKLVAEGYEKRDAEVASERARSLRPTWRVDSREADDIYYLHNYGYGVSDVVIKADPEFFEFTDGATEALIMGQLGDNRPGTSEGKQFRGDATPRGRREGVTFTLSWVDQNGDEQPKTAGGDLPGTIKLAAEPQLPIVRPTWQVGRAKNQDSRIHLLVDHTHEQSMVKNVSLECDPAYFTFMGQHEWNGELFGKGRPFPGEVTELGHNLGVAFTVSYEDVSSEQKQDIVLLPEGKGLYGYPGIL